MWLPEVGQAQGLPLLAGAGLTKWASSLRKACYAVYCRCPVGGVPQSPGLERRHVQGGAHRRATAPCDSLPAVAATIAIERRHPNQLADLRTAQTSQFRLPYLNVTSKSGSNPPLPWSNVSAPDSHGAMSQIIRWLPCRDLHQLSNGALFTHHDRRV